MSQLALGVLAAIALVGLAALFVFVFIVCVAYGEWFSCAVLAALLVILVAVLRKADSGI